MLLLQFFPLNFPDMWSLSLPSLVSIVNTEAEAQIVTPVDDVPLKKTVYVDPRTYPSIADAMKQVGVKEILGDELSQLDEIGCGEPVILYISWKAFKQLSC